MGIATSVTGFDLAIQERAYIEYRMFSAIRRFSRDCTRLAIRVEERGSPPRGRYRCSVVLDMMRGERVRVRATGSRLYVAIDGAADRLALAVERRLTAMSPTTPLGDRAPKAKRRERAMPKQHKVRALTGPVLVSTDLTPTSDAALREGDSLARALGGPLHVCHVMPDLLTVRMLFPQIQQRDDAAVQDLARHAGDLVEVSIARLTGRSPGEFRVGIESGSPHSGILRHAETVGAGVIVVGPGSVAESVVRYAHCPVLVARPSPPGIVLAATDFSDSALPAVAAGAAEAARRGVVLAVLHSLDLGFLAAATYEGAYAMLPPLRPQDQARLRAETLEALRHALESVPATGDTIVVDGRPGPAIVEAARTLPAQLVVVGTVGRTGLSRLALGSVAEAVVRSAPCSTLVVRLRPEEAQ